MSTQQLSESVRSQQNQEVLVAMDLVDMYLDLANRYATSQDWDMQSMCISEINRLVSFIESHEPSAKCDTCDSFDTHYSCMMPEHSTQSAVPSGDTSVIGIRSGVPQWYRRLK